MSDPEAAPLSRLDPVLVANRGEIAIRVISSAHGLGLGSVAIHTDADAALRAPHIAVADRSERIESYLEPDAVLAAAHASGARAIHPGYGFLSENPAFAAAVLDAGLVWIGPPPAAIELMGDKGRAKRLAAEAGVPVVPGTGAAAGSSREEGGGASAEEIAAFADEHGFPLVIKALGGGGGKGMRVVREASELEEGAAAARREAEAAFGDGRVLAERYLERPRHIEIQVLADAHGNVVHLGERECSLQRRHQKVIEEAPSPIVDEAMRERMGAAAVELARACSYEGAGTVEFIVPADGSGFHFLEMNTRLQVEHPVTEMVWGVDLVRQQLRVAAGESLGFGQGDLAPDGHAVEARLYAEDPAAGFLPVTGTVRRWRPPAGPGIRLDAAIAEGAAIGTDYDPMLGKLIAHGPDRPTALRRLERALGELELLGITTNAGFGRALLRRDDVLAGELDTGLLERALDELDLEPPPDLLLAAAVALYLADTAGVGVEPGPWRRRLQGHGEVRIEAARLELEGGEPVGFRLLASDSSSLLLELDGTARTYSLVREEDAGAVWVGRAGFQLEARPERSDRAGSVLAGSLEAPMPGKVLAVEVANGDEVAADQLLMVLESMKMELRITAPSAGTVEGLELAVGDQVSQGQVLVAVSDAEQGESDE